MATQNSTPTQSPAKKASRTKAPIIFLTTEDILTLHTHIGCTDTDLTRFDILASAVQEPIDKYKAKKKSSLTTLGLALYFAIKKMRPFTSNNTLTALFSLGSFLEKNGVLQKEDILPLVKRLFVYDNEDIFPLGLQDFINRRAKKNGR